MVYMDVSALGDGSLDNLNQKANRLQTILLATCRNRTDTPYTYAYDDNGNITEITQGTTSVTYEYNRANELVRENNEFTQPHDYL